MSVLLQAKFRHMGRSAADPGAGSQSGFSNNHDKVFPAAAGIYGTRRIRVTVCNVPATVTGEVLAAFISRYGRVEESNLLRSASGTAYGDHVFRLCLTREGFQATPEIIISRERQMMVVVEGRRLRAVGAVSSWDIYPNSVPRRTLQVLQFPQPSRLPQLQQLPQPPSAVQQPKSRVRSSLKKRREVGPR